MSAAGLVAVAAIDVVDVARWAAGLAAAVGISVFVGALRRNRYRRDDRRPYGGHWRGDARRRRSRSKSAPTAKARLPRPSTRPPEDALDEQPFAGYADERRFEVEASEASGTPDEHFSHARRFGSSLGDDAHQAHDERTLARTPHLDAPSDVPTADGDSFDVTVRLDMEDYEPGEDGEVLRIDLPRGVERITVGVLLTPSVHFHIDGPYAPLEIAVGQDEVALPPFTVRVATATEDEPDEAGITALFVYNGRACGSVTRRWRWSRSTPTAPSIVDAKPELAAMHVGVDDEQPDLTVFVTRPTNDGINFQVAVQTRLLREYDAPTASVPWALPEIAHKFVSAHIDRIIFGATPEKRRIALRGAGVAFWDAAPPLFQDVLWQLIENGTPPRNIFIASEEPALPWELMIPGRLDDDGIVEDREPLGVEFPIGRWVANVGRRRKQRIVPNLRIVVSRTWVVAPVYKNRAQIDARAETGFLEQHLHGALAQPANEVELDRRFGEAPAELVHFVCHGETTPDADALILDDETQMLATDVRVRNGFQALCRQGRPLIFINACNAGNLTAAIGGATGFPKTFGDLGARAIIAPLWSVTDVKAGPIAVDLYTRALNEPGRTLAELVRDIRARAYYDAEFDDSFAAYCLFGDPLITLEAAARASPTGEIGPIS